MTSMEAVQKIKQQDNNKTSKDVSNVKGHICPLSDLDVDNESSSSLLRFWINDNQEKLFCLIYNELLAKSILISCSLKLDEDNDKKY